MEVNALMLGLLLAAVFFLSLEEGGVTGWMMLTERLLSMCSIYCPLSKKEPPTLLAKHLALPCG